MRKLKTGLHKRAVGLFQPICEIMKIFHFFHVAHIYNFFIFLSVKVCEKKINNRHISYEQEMKNLNGGRKIDKKNDELCII